MRSRADPPIRDVVGSEPPAQGLTEAAPRNRSPQSECPDPSADTDADGLVSLEEGAPIYGGILASFTETGDTSPASGLVLERFPVASAEGTISYHRTFKISQDVAKSLDELHIVLHGTDLPSDDDSSSLSSLFEATLPVSCGYID